MKSTNSPEEGFALSIIAIGYLVFICSLSFIGIETTRFVTSVTYTTPASTSPNSTFVLTDLTSVSYTHLRAHETR